MIYGSFLYHILYHKLNISPEERKLEQVGVQFTRTVLEEPVFVKKTFEGEFLDGWDSIFPQYWTPEQLRAIADFMEVQYEKINH